MREDTSLGECGGARQAAGVALFTRVRLPAHLNNHPTSAFPVSPTVHPVARRLGSPVPREPSIPRLMQHPLDYERLFETPIVDGGSAS